MGGVYAATAQGAESMFQNPAALARLQPESPSEAALGYDSLLETAYQGAAAYARPLGRDAALGAGLVYASQSPQTYYSATGDANGSFAPLDVAAGAAVARRFGPCMVGGGLKLIQSSLADRSATTGAVDFGALVPHAADLGDGNVDVGAAVSNLGPPLKLGPTANALPLAVRGGAVFHMSPTLDAALDGVFQADADPYAALGVEARFPASLVNSSRPWTAALRVGYNQNATRGVDGLSGLSFGAGLDVATLRVDYAWVLFGNAGSVSRITIAFRF